jgi:tape measure domain-containing protein
MAEIQGLVVRLEATTALLRGELARADRSIANTATQAERNAARAERAISQIGSSLSGVFAGLSAGAVARDLIQTTMQFEKLDFRIRNLSGSAAAFEENQRYISQAANRMGIDIVTATNSFAGLLAAQQNGKISGDQARDIFEGMANVSAALGISNEQLKLSFFGLGQVLGSATVTMEDVRQVTDPLPGLFDKIAAASGRTGGELKALISDGKVTADVFSRLLIKALEEYAGKAEQAAEGLNGSWTRLQNAWIELKRTLEDPITDTLTPLLNAAKTALQTWQLGNEGFKPMEERSPARLRYDRDRVQEGRVRAEMRNANGSNEDLDWYDKQIRQIDARLAFLEGPPAGSGPAAAAPAAAPQLAPPPPPKKTKTDAEKEADKATREREAAAKRVAGAIADLQHEEQQLGRTAKEQAVYNAYKAAGITETDAAALAVRANAEALYDAETAHENVAAGIKAENDQLEEGRRLYEQVRSPLDAYNDRLLYLRQMLNAGAIDQRTFNLAVAEAKEAFDTAQKSANKLPKELQFLADTADQSFDRVGSSITQAFTQGEAAAVSLRNVGLGVVSELMQAFIELSLINPLKNAMTGGDNPVLATVLSTGIKTFGAWLGSGSGITDPTGGTFGGTGNGFAERAAGGPVSAGQAYVVGEKRPELFVPSVNGTILPRLPTVAGGAAAAGDSFALTQHLHISTGVQGTVRAEIQNMLPQIVATSRAAMLEAQARRGRSL